MDLEKYIQTLDETTGQIIAVLYGCDATQLVMREAGKWNALEIAEHVLLTEQMIMALLTKPALKSAETAELFGNEKLNRIMVGMRGRKVIAPKHVNPTGRITNVQLFEEQFNTTRENLKKNLLSGKIKIDNSVYQHPMLGDMTVSDWLNLIPQHCLRHIEQIKDAVKSSQN